jgi:hypothetical protein
MMWDTTGQAKDEEEETVMRGVRALSAPVLGSWAFSFLSMRSHIMAARTLSICSLPANTIACAAAATSRAFVLPGVAVVR